MTKALVIAASLVLAVGCSKKGEDKPAPKAVESEPAPAKSEPAKTEPAKTEPAKPAGDNLVTAPEAKLVEVAGTIAGDKKTELAWTAPSGEKVTLTVKQVWKSKKAVMELVATTDGKPATLVAYGTGIEKDDIHTAPIGAVGAGPDGSVVFVTGTSKITGKAADSYEAYVFTWDASAKQLKQARKQQWDEGYDPAQDKAMEEQMDRESAGKK
jgi:hypothetical protein